MFHYVPYDDGIRCIEQSNKMIMETGLGDSYYGWKVRLYYKNDAVFDNTVKRTRLIYGWTAALVIGLSGCVTPQSPAPAMPPFATGEGKMCARSCQEIYAQCNLPCGQMVGAATASHRRQCLENCNQTLSDCYSTCE